MRGCRRTGGRGFADADDGALDIVGLGDQGDRGVEGVAASLPRVVAGLDDILSFFGHGSLGSQQGHSQIAEEAFDGRVLRAGPPRQKAASRSALIVAAVEAPSGAAARASSAWAAASVTAAGGQGRSGDQAGDAGEAGDAGNRGRGRCGTDSAEPWSSGAGAAGASVATGAGAGASDSEASAGEAPAQRMSRKMPARASTARVTNRAVMQPARDFCRFIRWISGMELGVMSAAGG